MLEKRVILGVGLGLAVLAGCGPSAPARGPGAASAEGAETKRQQAAKEEAGASAGAKKSAKKKSAKKQKGSVPVGTVLSGEASYYADSLAGRSTASGEPYDPKEMTAAHRTLPFGTRVEVTRESSGAKVIVRINDRGPFGKKTRILDLSRKAAESLGIVKAGVAKVKVRVLGADGGE
ncbi:MAG: septal ring lytic transglycosylase RlpA family protein [Polyangiaceae bacterium]